MLTDIDGEAHHRLELVKSTANVLNVELHYLPLYRQN